MIALISNFYLYSNGSDHGILCFRRLSMNCFHGRCFNIREIMNSTCDKTGILINWLVIM